MAQQNLPNGLQSQMSGPKPIGEQPPLLFNGVNSSHSSRDSSPSTRQIPPSQMPPLRSGVPPSQLPPSRSPHVITQKMANLNVNSSNFNTSTPNQTLQNTSGLIPSAFSPVNPIQSSTNAGNPVLISRQQPQGNHNSHNTYISGTRTLISQGASPYSNQIAHSGNQSRVIPSQNSQIPTPRPLVSQNTSAPPSQAFLPQGQPVSQTVPYIAPAAPKPPQNNNPAGSVLPVQHYQQSHNYNTVPSSTAGSVPGHYKANLHSNRYPQQQQQQHQQNNFYQQQQQQQPQHFSDTQSYQPSVGQSGFNRLWGQEHIDLLQTPNILPQEKLISPRVFLGNEALDTANCSPEVFQCTMTKMPESSSLLQKSRLPLGILIHPFKDLTHLPVIQCNVIVRCRACRTYINPFVFFVDTKRWKCNLCYRINELPEEFQFDPVSKTYGDPSRRPEIKSSTIEYIAPAEYMLRPPQPAVYLFLFDICRLAIESGYLQSACAVLLEELKNLPGDTRTQIGIIAYDSALHFFALGEGLSQPHEMTVLEIDDVFLPCPDNLLVNLKDRMEMIVDLLTQLPTRFNNTYDNNSALGAALQVAHRMIAATGGRVTVFQASLPNVGPGALIPREDPSQRAGTEVEHLNPANDFYKRLALECSGQQIAVDLFVVNSQYVDIATISGISRFSGGSIHQFPLFKASRVLQNERFERCFRRYLTRKIGFEAVMRIRCTRGLSIHTFHGNFFVRSTDLLSLPNVSPDAGFGMQVSIDESLSDVQSVCFQAALLYTSSKGERRIRVHTLCLPICSTLSDVINAADQQCIVGLLAKMAVDRSMQSSLADAREAFINVAIDILSSYKLALNMGNDTGSLFAPQCLRVLPLYISALLKYIAFRIGVSTRLDDRVKAMIDMKTKPLNQLIQLIYPDLYAVHNLEEQPVILNTEEDPVAQPPRIQLTARCLDSKGAFLLDTGEHMVIIVGPGVSQVFLNDVLGVRDYTSISDDMYDLPVLNNVHNQRLHCFINYLNDEKPFVATLQIIRDNSPNRIEFFERLIEDRVENAMSYHEFMQYIKTQVK